MYTLEKLSMLIVIKDEFGKIVEEFQERELGKFPFWNKYTEERAEKRLTELNK